MAKRTRRYIWQYVIGFGFLSGLWTAIGIDPEEVMISGIGKAVDAVCPDPTLRLVFLLLPILLLLISAWEAYRRGRVIGIASVLVAYVAGLSVFRSPALAVLLVAGAVMLGIIATNRRLVRGLA